MKKAFTFLVLVLLFSQIQAQNEDSVDLFELSLEELLSIEVGVATKKATSLRENPAVITVITKEDIQSSGAKDLMELFTLLVPGFQFGVDVEGAVGLGIRGLWANEGKSLLMIDGMDMNEEMFATVEYGNHFPVDMIERIEIVRGPGSAVYGGYAGLSVINVITKGADQKGGYLTKTYSQTSNALAYDGIAFGYGNRIGDLGLSINTALNNSIRSDLDNVDFNQLSMPMIDNSAISSSIIAGAVDYKGFKLSGVADLYRLKQIDLWGENFEDGPLDQSWDSYLTSLEYKGEVIKHLTVMPRIQYKKQYPWHLSVISEEYVNSKSVEKILGNLNLMYDVNQNINVLVGGEYYDNALLMPENPGAFEETFNTGDNRLATNNTAAFAQLMAYTNFINVTLGSRYDYSSQYGGSFVPRIALTKLINDFHAKLMLSESIRIPGGIIPNRIPEGVDGIEPEKATNYEMEVGYQFNKQIYISANVFDVSFDKVIVYGADPTTGLGSYLNQGQIGTQGIESEVRIKFDKASMLCNYAFYQQKESTVEGYQIPDNDDAFLGLAQHRLNTLIKYKLMDNIGINVSCSYFGERFGYDYAIMSTGSNHLKKYDPFTMINVNMEVFNLLNKQLAVNVGCQNLLSEKVYYIQPYDGAHAPLPGLSRTINLKCMLKF